MTTGSSLDIIGRVKRLIPNRWFLYTAANRDAILGGISDLASWGYSFIYYARSQSRLATAYGIWLDIFSYDFLSSFVTRSGLNDNIFRVFIRATILQERVTRAGMISGLTSLVQTVPRIFEPWNTFDTGAYGNGSMGYGIGQGGYGNMNLPAQTFIDITRILPSGVPSVDGYANPIGSWGAGAIEYMGSALVQIGITNAIIYRLINYTKPTGTIMWVRVGAPAIPVRRPCIFNITSAKSDTQNIAII